jgi:flagellar motility protein MotE (MotC chaperone)
MRWVRMAVLASLVLKLTVLGAWWWSAPAWAEKRPPGKALPAERGASAAPDDLMGRSRGFRDLLAAVQERAQVLGQREEDLEGREAALRDLEKAIAEQASRLEGLAKTAGAASSGPGDAVGPAVTKIYESMKAEEAAPILDQLDDATVGSILGRMKEKKIGEMLAAMNRERAVAVTRLLSEKR